MRRCGTYTDIYAFGLSMLMVMTQMESPAKLLDVVEEISEGETQTLFVDTWKEEVCHYCKLTSNNFVLNIILDRWQRSY